MPDHLLLSHGEPAFGWLQPLELEMLPCHRAAVIISTLVFWRLVGVSVALTLLLIRDFSRIVRGTAHPAAQKAAANPSGIMARDRESPKA